MDCCICYEAIKDHGFLCYRCTDGKPCYYGKYLSLFVLIETKSSMYKVVPCPVCRSTYKEEYVDN